MKRITIIILGLLNLLSMAYCQDYYWYKGNKISLRRGNQQYILYQ